MTEKMKKRLVKMAKLLVKADGDSVCAFISFQPVLPELKDSKKAADMVGRIGSNDYRHCIRKKKRHKYQPL